MDPHSLRPPARRRMGREGDQAVLEAGDAGGGARAPSGVGESHLHKYSGWLVSRRADYLRGCIQGWKGLEMVAPLGI